MAFLRTPKKLRRLRKNRRRVRYDNDETCVLPNEGIDDASDGSDIVGGPRGEK
jgi:hypothetical protein